MGQQNQSATNTKLNRIAWLSKQDSKKEFGCLMHLFNNESLLECFHELDKNKAVGIDGVTKMDYGANLYNNIDELITKMKNMAYRPGPVREVLIPKEGKPGATRPLGISNLEDKIVQKMTQKVLESIYEPLFLECSHGFRPGKSCHTAIQALNDHLYRNYVQTVIDIDLKNFFGTIEHSLLEGILKEKIKDPKFMRYINRMFKSGVLTKGELTVNEEGVPQGSICSPVLANIFAHYAIDTWIEEMVKPACKGTVALFRYADDGVICCELATDALRIRQSLGKRLEKFKLQLNEEKTKLVPFDKRMAAQGIKQGTFDFLGFTFYWGKAQSGWIIPKLKTRAKTMRTKLKKVNEWAKQIRHEKPLKEIWQIFKAKLRGHIQYYGVSHNSEEVKTFLFKATEIVFKWLNRRSQRKSFVWEKFQLFMATNPLPTSKVVHPLCIHRAGKG
jgi:group II intron reverse transcriptase/maturase